MRKAYSPIIGIAPEGWVLLLPIAAMLAGLLYAGHWVGAALLLPLIGALALVFLDPERVIPSAPLGIVSPVDGTVTAVERLYDPVLKRQAVRIAIAVKQLGSYAVRAPSEGVVCAPPSRWDDRGTSWIRTDEGDSVLLLGSHSRIPPMRFAYGRRVGQGQRCAPRRFHRRFDVVVPESVRVEVEVGQGVRSGSDLLATLIRKG